ncbi:type VI secretion system contractile sheath small subunit [Shewanella khirikhana]|uniref:Type VI secretion protein n=1 Tax=Shewanella khirikhana TaxID=1965282 RepID=A0ABN5TV33_9GAMM|nr:type VI secretion system contractile sheath small subunit [Shewanella khirikhana]AZQ10881.1 hypothetical protein STH12_01773 [Shewanella khirikhana]
MSKNGSVAPKERINIKYVPATGDQQQELELPLKLLVLGDYKGHPDEAVLEDRKAIQVDKSNFESVMKEAQLSISANVDNKLSEDAADGAELSIDLKFESMRDFTPDAVAAQVPELQKLIELREALVALKGPLGNIPAFRAKLQDLIASEESREALLSELQSLEN